jgi:hypothetical protein
MFVNLRNAWHEPAWRAECGVSVAVFLPVLFALTRFLDGIERRSGVIAGVVFLLQHPRRLLLGLQGYALMALFRMAAMFIVPLDPPAGIIVLRDPVVEMVAGAGTTLTRDLFFSGHTSTMFLLFLLIPGRRVRIAYICATIIVAVCVVLQHVHYTVDVFVAPFFAYGAYAIVLGVCKKRGILVN